MVKSDSAIVSGVFAGWCVCSIFLGCVFVVILFGLQFRKWCLVVLLYIEMVGIRQVKLCFRFQYFTTYGLEVLAARLEVLDSFEPERLYMSGYDLFAARFNHRFDGTLLTLLTFYIFLSLQQEFQKSTLPMLLAFLQALHARASKREKDRHRNHPAMFAATKSLDSRAA